MARFGIRSIDGPIAMGGAFQLPCKPTVVHRDPQCRCELTGRRYCPARMHAALSEDGTKLIVDYLYTPPPERLNLITMSFTTKEG